MTEQHQVEDLAGPGWITEHCSEGGFAVSYKVDKCLHEEETPFQKLAVYQSSHFGKILLLDGYIQVGT
jgi:spermidine synthase